jgi:hypothetical protein
MFSVWLGLLAGMILLGAAFTAWLIRRSVRERHAFDWSVTRYEGRHQVARPREAPSLSPPAAGGDPHPQLTETRPGRTGEPRAVPAVRGGRGGVAPSPRPVTRSHVPAADTGRLPRVHLDTATTGEIRAVGDRIVAAIERGGI